MSALADAATFATDPALTAPLTAAIARAAMAIANEDEETPSHSSRKALASRVLNNPSGFAPVFAWALSTNSTVVGKWVNGDAESALNDLDFVLASVWDAMAGA